MEKDLAEFMAGKQRQEDVRDRREKILQCLNPKLFGVDEYREGVWQRRGSVGARGLLMILLHFSLETAGQGPARRNQGAID